MTYNRNHDFINFFSSETVLDTSKEDQRLPITRYIVHNREKWLEAQPEGCIPDHIFVSQNEIAVKDSSTPDVPNGRKFLVRFGDNGEEQLTEISGTI